MGVVYKARQVALNRLVALKMILHAEHAGEGLRERFQIEAQALARLQHPSIVQIYEVGEHAGLPYFALEFCGGGSLADQLDGTPWEPRRAAALVETLARAVHAAHQAQVVHRDLKPANILLSLSGRSESGADSTLLSERPLHDCGPKITDFGLAKRLDEAGRTASGALVGTPSYMSPEQAGGKSQEIGPACDVYSLGAILYELLTGRPPFRATTALDTALQVLSEEPVAVRRLQPKVPRDLEVICLKCLEKDSRRRFASALELAEDLQHFYKGEPIVARPVGRLERIEKWVRRKPLTAGLGATAAGLALFVLIAGPWAAVHQSRLRQTAESREQEAVSAQQTAEEQRNSAQEAATREKAAHQQAEQAQRVATEEKEKTTANLYATRIALAHREWQSNNVQGANSLLEACPSHLRGWEWRYLKRLCHTEAFSVLGGRQVAFSPDGKRLATSGDGLVALWDASDGRKLLSIAIPSSSRVSRISFSPDGRRLATTDDTRSIRICDTHSGKVLFTIPQGGSSPTFSPKGDRIAAATKAEEITLWDWAKGTKVLTLHGHGEGVKWIEFSPDGQRLASAHQDGAVKIWDANTGQLQRTCLVHKFVASSVAFSPDGAHLASSSYDGTVRIWEVRTGLEVRTLHGHVGWIYRVVYSPDGRQLASAGWDQTVRIWEADTGREISTLRGHKSYVFDVAYSPLGHRLAAAAGVVKVWEIQSGQDALTLKNLSWLPTDSVAFSADGTKLAAGSRDGKVRVWDSLAGTPLRTMTGRERWVRSVAFSPDSRLLAAGNGAPLEPETDGEIYIWEVATGREVRVLRGQHSCINSVAFSPDGRLLASGSGRPLGFLMGMGRKAEPTPGEIKIWDVASGQEVRTLRGHGAGVNGVAFSPDGSHLVSAGDDHSVKIWSVASGQETSSFRAVLPQGVAWSADGKRAAAAAGDLQVHVWEPEGGREVLQLRGHSAMCWGVAFSPDGRRLASTSHDTTVKVWHAASGQELASLRGHGHEVYAVAFSSDGRQLASCSWDGVRICDAGAWETIPPNEWKTVFQEDFNRVELGKRWQEKQGRWSIAQGVLRAELAAAQPKSGSAAIRLIGEELPDWVDIRFDYWSPDGLAFQVALTDKDESEAAILTMSNREDSPLDLRGALLQSAAKHLGADTLVNPEFRLQPQQRHRIRFLREPHRIAFFVDDSEVLTDVPPLQHLTTLAIGVLDGKAGSVAFLDNLEIRAPAPKAVERAAFAAQERQARWLVRFLVDKHLIKDRVLGAVRTEPTLTEAVRAAALRFADEYAEDPERLTLACLDIVKSTRESRQAYHKAVELAEVAARLKPHDSEFLTMLGLAQLRAGKAADASTTLTRANRMHQEQRGHSLPANLAFLALAHQQLGQTAAAREAFLQLRDCTYSNDLADNSTWHFAVREAEAALGALLTPALQEQEAIKHLVFSAVQAGWLHGDLAKYLSVWTEDGREVLARGEKPGPHDLTLTKPMLGETRRLQFHPPLDPIKLIYENAQVDVAENRAVLRSRLVVQLGDRYWIYDGVTHLRRTLQEWQIYEDRLWLVQRKDGDRVLVYDQPGLEKMDAAMEALRQKGDLAKLADALAEARRPAEAYQVARQLTQNAKATASDWVLRGRTAVEAGAAKDALASFRKALTLDPEARIPAWVRTALQQPSDDR
jgi:WD40 repeat protein/tetratricopeptide (TPR) repeat protein